MFLTWADYTVTVIMLLIPLGIGIFYAWKDAKKLNREEYLLGGRTMKMVPVALSMLVTFQSAISLIGFPSEVYRHGIMAVLYYVGCSLSVVIGIFTMVPLMHPLKMTSIYDYLEKRYKSRAVRVFGTLLGMLVLFFYMVIALVAPALALQAAADIPFWMSVAVVGGTGTLYTAIGGFKSVIWTDVFQSLIMVGGLILLITKGMMVVGGAEKVWNVAEEGGRTNMMQFSPDPRTRHTWWSLNFGLAISWTGPIFSQSNFQRVSAMPTMESAKKASLLSIPLMLIYDLLLVTLGIIVYSYFYFIRCDPLEGGMVTNMNQVSVYFMLHVLKDWPGITGLFMATIFSGALSTLSSGISALAANTVEDLLEGSLRGVSERKATIVTKVIVFAYGIAIVGFAYLAKSLQGPISQICTAVTSSFSSVVVGIFVAGFTVPWANKYGVFVGGVLSAALNSWIVIGNFLYGKKIRPLAPAPTDQCPAVVHESPLYNSTSWYSIWNDTMSSVSVSTSHDADDPYQYGFFLYDITYEWYGTIGIVVCSLTILFVSKLTRRYVKHETDPACILPSLRKFWQFEYVPEKDPTELHSLDLNI